MTRKVYLWIGFTASALWLLVNASFAVNTLAHGTDGAIIKWMNCKQATPHAIAVCDERFKSDAAAEMDGRWLLIGTRTFGPLAAGWYLGFALLRRRRAIQSATDHLQPPPPFT
jgi:hypothetical protein